MAWFAFQELRPFPVAQIHGFGTARLEITAAWRIYWTRHIALKNDLFSSEARVRNWASGNESLRVWVLCPGIENLAICQFNHLAQIHDCHPVADMFY